MLQSFKDVFQRRKWTRSIFPSKTYNDAAAHFQFYLKSKTSSSFNTRSSPRSEHPYHVALDCPEILERIFGFLSQYTLRNSVRLVCVHWNNVARPLVNLLVRWRDQDEWTDDRFPFYPFFNTLSLASGLLPIASNDQHNLNSILKYETNAQARWSTLFEHLQHLSQMGQLHFRTLQLRRPYKIQYQVFPIVAILAPTLTTLELNLVQDKILHLGPIMDLCHHLKTLLVNGCRTNNVHTIATLLKITDTHHSSYTSASGHIFAHPLSSRYLTRLCITFVRVQQVDLEALIHRCPNLRDLTLRLAIYPRGTQPRETNVPTSTSPFKKNVDYHPLPVVDAQPLINFVRALCPHLTYFQYTPFNTTASLWRELPEMIITPITSSLKVSLFMHGSRASWQRIKYFIPHFARLTTLCIQRQLADPQVLHMILCTAPLLLEVVASEANYLGEYLYPPDANLPLEVSKDVDAEILQQGLRFDRTSFSAALAEHYAGRGGGSRCYGAVKSGKEVWACRGLRVLDLRIRPAEFGEIGTATLYEARLKMSRIVFAYLAEVCPMLSELTLEREDGLWPGMDGGLCLLAGLEELERITIRTKMVFEPSERDFDWLGGQKAYPCKLSYKGEESLRGGGSWQESQQRDDHACDGARNDGPMDRDSLVGKWSLREVKNMRSRLLESSEQVWPRLTYLCIRYQRFSSSSVRSPKRVDHVRKTVRGMRPAVEFICKPVSC